MISHTCSVTDPIIPTAPLIIFLDVIRFQATFDPWWISGSILLCRSTSYSKQGVPHLCQLINRVTVLKKLGLCTKKIKMIKNMLLSFWSSLKSEERCYWKETIQDIIGKAFYPILFVNISMNSCSGILQSHPHSINTIRWAELLCPPWVYCNNPDYTLIFIRHLQFMIQNDHCCMKAY